MKPTLIVLAAGIGSRYGGLKQIDPVGPNGELILDYSVYDALQAGFGKLVFVIREAMAREFREAIGARFEAHMEVAYVFQELDRLPAGMRVPPERAKPWGTGHAVLTARDAVETAFGVINADDFYGASGYRALIDFWAAPSGGSLPAYALVSYRLQNTMSDHGHVARGICRDDGRGRLVEITEMTHIEQTPDGIVNTGPAGERTRLTGDEPVSMNLWGLDPSIFPHLERLFGAFLAGPGRDPKAEFFLPSAVNTLLTEGAATCRVLATDARWTGVTYQGDRPAVKAFIATLVNDGVYPSPLWSRS